MFPISRCLILLLKLFLIALKCNHKCPTEVRSKYCQVQMIYSISVFIGILGQVWYLIVSIPDLCPFLIFLTYSWVILMSVSFSPESSLNLMFELLIFSLCSRVNEDAKKLFSRKL